MQASLSAPVQFCVRVKPAQLRASPRAKTVTTSALPREADADFTRRSLQLGTLLGAALGAASFAPANAAYGEAAKVFGSKPTNATGFVPYKGGGFSLLLPARWVPTLERDDKDVKLRYEDTYPANNLLVYAKKTSKNSVSDYGSPENFIKEMSFLFGDNTWQGSTRSEGGFKANKVSAASILDASTVTGKDGKPHINAHILTRSADGNEGGRHHIVAATISNGQLYVMKAQIGDKRWNKGGSRDSKTLQESFAVA